MTLVAFGEICLSKVEIKTVEPEEKEEDDGPVDDLNSVVQHNSMSTVGTMDEYEEEEEELMDID